MHIEKYLKKKKAYQENNNFWLNVPKTKLVETLRDMKKIGLSRVSSISGTDIGKEIDVIYHFIHGNKTINIRVLLDKKKCSVESITPVFPGANLFERELAEMLGVNVKNHPNLKLLFLSEKSPKTPMRKS